MNQKEERMIALLEAHEHISECIGSYRHGLGNAGNVAEAKLTGMQKSQRNLRTIIIDTALDDCEP